MPRVRKPLLRRQFWPVFVLMALFTLAVQIRLALWMPDALASRVLAKSQAPLPLVASDAFEDLIAWLRERGGTVHPGLRLGQEPGRPRGVYMAQDLAGGVEVLRVPRDAIVTEAVASRSGLGCHFARACQRVSMLASRNSSERLSLAGFLLARLHADRTAAQVPACGSGGEPHTGRGAFDPYVQTLPREEELNGMPAFGASKDGPCRRALAGSAVLRSADSWREGRAQEWSALVGELPWLSGLFYEQEFLHANALVQSRDFSLQMGPSKKKSDWIAGLVPLADMLNMGITPNTDWSPKRTYTEGAFVMRASNSVSAGSELLDTYSETKSNRHLFEAYGFFFPYARHFEGIKLELSAGTKDWQKSLLWLKDFAGHLKPGDTRAAMETAHNALLLARTSTSVAEPFPSQEVAALRLLAKASAAELQQRWSGMRAEEPDTLGDLQDVEFSSGDCQLYARLAANPYKEIHEFARRAELELVAGAGGGEALGDPLGPPLEPPAALLSVDSLLAAWRRWRAQQSKTG